MSDCDKTCCPQVTCNSDDTITGCNFIQFPGDTKGVNECGNNGVISCQNSQVCSCSQQIQGCNARRSKTSNGGTCTSFEGNIYPLNTRLDTGNCFTNCASNDCNDCTSGVWTTNQDGTASCVSINAARRSETADGGCKDYPASCAQASECCSEMCIGGKCNPGNQMLNLNSLGRSTQSSRTVRNNVFSASSVHLY